MGRPRRSRLPPCRASRAALLPVEALLRGPLPSVSLQLLGFDLTEWPVALLALTPFKPDRCCSTLPKPAGHEVDRKMPSTGSIREWTNERPAQRHRNQLQHRNCIEMRQANIYVEGTNPTGWKALFCSFHVESGTISIKEIKGRFHLTDLRLQHRLALFSSPPNQ